MRQEYLKIAGVQCDHCRNLPYLKRDCDNNIDTIKLCKHFNRRNLPYLKRDCDHIEYVPPVVAEMRRNLPYLKRDCDLKERLSEDNRSATCRNLPYLKRDCDTKNLVQNLLGIGVETCPT